MHPRPRLPDTFCNTPATRRGKKKEIFIMRIGTNELLIILVVALLIFGPKNLPKLGKMFGKTINGFKKGMEDEEGSDDSEEKTEKKVSKKDEDEE
jgi:sec-independent protein translocase protein TatA